MTPIIFLAENTRIECALKDILNCFSVLATSNNNTLKKSWREKSLVILVSLSVVVVSELLNSPSIVPVASKNHPCLELVHVPACYSCVCTEKEK